MMEETKRPKNKKIWLLFLIPVVIIILQIRSCMSSFTIRDAKDEPVTPPFMGEFGNWNPEIEEYFLNLIAPADDEYDFRYAKDYENFRIANLIKTQDAKPLRELLGHGDITVDMIADACERNDDIPPKYKKLIVEYASEVLAKYPETDFQVLYHNLQDLVVSEKTSGEIAMAAVGADVLACYLRNENEILVRNDIVVDKDDEGYIVFMHELTHAARSRSKETEGSKIKAKYAPEYDYGTYAEEAIACNLAYELQGDGERSRYYTLQSSYYRIIIDCLPDYTYADYFNHSVNYLADKMDEFMGHDKIAYHIIAMTDAEAINHYESFRKVKYTDYEELHAYICALYLKAHLNPDMSYDEAKKVYDDFLEEIHFNFENMKHPYDLSEDWFGKTFEKSIEEIGISAY